MSKFSHSTFKDNLRTYTITASGWTLIVDILYQIILPSNEYCSHYNVGRDND